VVRVMQKVTVSDDRADEVLVVRDEDGQERTYRLFPDLATAMRLYLAAILVRDHPLAAEQLPDSSLRLWVSMQYLTGTRLPDGKVRLTYGMTMTAPGTGASHLSYGSSTEVAVEAALEAEVLAAEIEASLKARAKAVVGDFVRAAAPFLTPAPDIPALES